MAHSYHPSKDRLNVDPRAHRPGTRMNFGGTTVNFRPDRTVDIFKPFATERMQNYHLEKFRTLTKDDLPDVCGNCFYCRVVDYGNGAFIPSCMHERSRDRDGRPLMVMPSMEPYPVCPLRNRHQKRRRSVFKMWATGKAPQT